MILALDTSTPACRVWLRTQTRTNEYEWEAGRSLADGLIRYLRERLHENGASWDDLTGIAVYRGPGSFTGLRIGLTVLNTIADSNEIPIIGESGEAWLERAFGRLDDGQNDKLVMPLYGREPNITKPRK